MEGAPLAAGSHDVGEVGSWVIVEEGLLPRNRLASLGRPVVSEESRIHKLSTTQRKPSKSTNSGSLVKLIGLPLDVFFEIATYLEPLDILYLARVSKHFRAVFRPQNSRHAWIAARRNVPGLPDCPVDLTEAQYASLMFEHVCQACGIKTPKVDFALRLSFCGACYKVNIRRGAAIARTADWGKISLTIYTLLPRARGSWEFEDKCNALVNTPCHAYYERELYAVAEQYHSLTTDYPALVRFIKHRQEFVTQLMQTGRKLQEWDNKCKSLETMQRNEKIMDREDDIEDRLVQLGWDESDFPPNSVYPYASRWRDAWAKLVEQPRRLTEKSWDNLRPKLIYILERIAEGKCQKEIADRISARQDDFAKLWTKYFEHVELWKRDLMPNGMEAANSPNINACLAEHDGRIEVTAERFKVLIPIALVEAQGHIPKIRQCLIERLEEYSFSPNPHPPTKITKYNDPLRHVTALFDCSGYWCQYLTFPELLSHRHIRERGQWSPSIVRYNSRVPSVVRDVLRALNLPLASTHNDLAHLDGKFKCLCGDPAMEYPTTFRAMIRHIIDVNAWYEGMCQSVESEKLRILSRAGQVERFNVQDNLCHDHATKNLPSLIRIVPMFEEACSLYPTKPGTPIAYCAVCRFLGGNFITTLRSLQDAVHHLQAKHKIPVESSEGLDALFARKLLVSHINRLAI